MNAILLRHFNRIVLYEAVRPVTSLNQVKQGEAARHRQACVGPPWSTCNGSPSKPAPSTVKPCDWLYGSLVPGIGEQPAGVGTDDVLMQ
jgi:hypothetical protein